MSNTSILCYYFACTLRQWLEVEQFLSLASPNQSSEEIHLVDLMSCSKIARSVCVCVAQHRNVMTYGMGGAPKTTALFHPPKESYCVRECSVPNQFI